MTMVYEENVTYSQILCGYMRRVLVAGVAESDRPGSIQIFRYDSQTQDKERLYKALEVQAHSKQIERMRLNYDNSKLFSIGLDGVLACFSMRDNDPVSKTNAQNQPPVEFSEEILIEKNKLDQTNKRIQDLKQEIDNIERNKQIQLDMQKLANETTIKELNEKIAATKQEFDEKNKLLEMKKQKIEQEAEEE